MPTIAIPSPPPIDGIAALPSLRTLGTGAQQAAAGNDARFGTPTGAQYTPAAFKIPLADAGGLISSGWIADASLSVRGLVSIGTQSFAGDKTFANPVSAADPTLSTHLTTKAYVDALANGTTWMTSVRVITLTNITLSGSQTIDGVSAIAGDRVLVAGQTAGQDNGIYVVAAGAWARSSDANTSPKVKAGMAVFINEGTVNADTAWVLTTNDPIVLGTTPLSFTAFSTTAIVAGSGISKSGNIISVNQGFVPTWTGTHTFNVAPILASMTLGSVLFAGSGGVVSQDNSKFFWDNSTKRLGIGTNVPGFTGGIVDVPGAQLHLNSSSTHSLLVIESTAASSDAGIWMGTTANGLDFALWMDETDSQKVKFSVGGNNTHSQRSSNAKMALTQIGAFGIGTMAPVSLLDVAGGISVGTYAGTSAAPSNGLIVSGFVGVGCVSPTAAQNLEVRNANGNAVGGQFAMRNTNPVGQGEFDVFDHNGTFRLSLGFDNNSVGGNPDAYYYTGTNTDFVFQTNNGTGIAAQRADGNWTFGVFSHSGINNTVATQHRVSIYKDVTWPGDTIDSQLALVGKTDASKILSIGCDTSGTHGYGFIAAGHQAVQWTFLALQPSGGQVAIGNTAPTTFLDIADGSGGNAAAIALRSGQNSAVSTANTGRIRYNATSQRFEISENGGAYTLLMEGARTSISDSLLTTTSATDVVTFTPITQGNYVVNIYYRVVTATTNLALNVTWTDGSGPQTQIVLNTTPQLVGSYVVAPIFINATAAIIKVTATADTANQIYISSSIASA